LNENKKIFRLKCLIVILTEKPIKGISKKFQVFAQQIIINSRKMGKNFKPRMK
jgi:hypothetical protein